MEIGYARVSTDDQNPGMQIAALKRAGCKRIFTDTASGASRKSSQLDKCLKALTAEDVLTVWKLDRLGLAPPQVHHARVLIEKGDSPAHVARLLGVARSTLYAALA
jgi:DNA invertase Pin-like site-specific DNA recombinase